MKVMVSREWYEQRASGRKLDRSCSEYKNARRLSQVRLRSIVDVECRSCSCRTKGDKTCDDTSTITSIYSGDCHSEGPYGRRWLELS
jgi:hypothetical protein